MAFGGMSQGLHGAGSFHARRRGARPERVHEGALGVLRDEENSETHLRAKLSSVTRRSPATAKIVMEWRVAGKVRYSRIGFWKTRLKVGED